MGNLFLLATATALAAPALAQGSDECAAAVDLGVGPTSVAFDTNVCTDTGLPASTSSEQQCFSLADDVWFKYTAQATGLASFDTCNSANFDTEIGVWEGADCSTFIPLGCNDDNPTLGCLGNTSFLTDVPVTAGQTYYIQVGYWDAAGAVWGSGTVTVSEFQDPCASNPADAFEDNDDCASAAPIGDGMFAGLNVALSDSDFYAVSVPQGSTLTVDAIFQNLDVDIDLYLWDPLVACGTAVEGEGATTGLALGFSSTDDENISFSNFTGGDLSLVLEVDVYSFSAGACGPYELIISGAGSTSPGLMGVNYCSQNANSTGQISTMSAFGLTSVAANDCTLMASNLPVGQFGLFLVSDVQAFVPNAGGSSNGNICLGGVLGNYNRVGQVMSSGGAGEISLQISLAAIPQGGGTVMTTSGDTWNFQAWHRDDVGLGSNLTDGLEITFTQ